MVDSLCTGTKDESGIMVACYLILEACFYDTITIQADIDENFPDHCCWRDGSATEEHTKMWIRSKVFRKGHQLLKDRNFVGVKLPEEKEPVTGIDLDTLERFFDQVAVEKGVKWRSFNYIAYRGERRLDEPPSPNPDTD